MMKQRWSFVIVLIFWVGSLVGCATTKGDWQNATQLNTVEAYKEFLLKHSQSEFSNSARKNIEKLEWESAKRNDNLESYQQFISKYPYSEFTNSAKNRIEELEWQMTININNIKGYQKFLQKYPSSTFSKQANKKIETLEWEEAKTINSHEGYSTFLNKYPNSEFAKQAKEQLRILEELAWQKTTDFNTLEGYNNFLEKYPQSRFTPLAKEKIDRLKEIELDKDFDIGWQNLVTKHNINPKLKDAIRMYYRAAKNTENFYNKSFKSGGNKKTYVGFVLGVYDYKTQSYSGLGSQLEQLRFILVDAGYAEKDFFACEEHSDNNMSGIWVLSRKIKKEGWSTAEIFSSLWVGFPPRPQKITIKKIPDCLLE